MSLKGPPNESKVKSIWVGMFPKMSPKWVPWKSKVKHKFSQVSLDEVLSESKKCLQLVQGDPQVKPKYMIFLGKCMKMYCNVNKYWEMFGNIWKCTERKREEKKCAEMDNDIHKLMQLP